jgi:O-antigen/teichoic acid export membrane protein
MNKIMHGIRRFNNAALFKNIFYKHSFYIYLSLLASSALGFVFWLIAAKYYSPVEVGLATAVISLVNLIVLVSRLGLDQSLIRYLPSSGKDAVFSTTLVTTSITTLGMFIFFFILNEPILGEYSQVGEQWLLVLLITMGTSVVSIYTVMFNALRKSELNLLQNTFMGLRVILLLLFVNLTNIGILLSIGISLIVTTGISTLYLIKSKISFWEFNVAYLRASFSFSSSNFLSNILFVSPNYLIPIISMSLLGAEKTAYYYISYSIISILYMIPNSIGLSLFIEGSYGDSLRKTVMSSLKITYAILIPAIVLVYFAIEPLLSIIGSEYVHMVNFIRIMAFSAIFIANTFIYTSIIRITKKNWLLLLINAMLFTALIVSSYLLMLQFDLIGIAYSWLFSYLFINLVVLLLEAKGIIAYVRSYIK